MTDWRKLGAGLAGVAACAVLAWFSYGRSGQVPLLSGVDLGFHELGHMLAAPMPTMVMFLAGSAAQIMVPLGLAAYFSVARRDAVATGLMLAWAGTSARDVSVYIADAPFQRLPLIGGQHDWAYLLGPNGWSALGSAETIASVVLVAGGLAVLAGSLVCLLVALDASGLIAPRPLRLDARGDRRIRPARYRSVDRLTTTGTNHGDPL